jgi:ATP-binding cassette subfamily F protein 1
VFLSISIQLTHDANGKKLSNRQRKQLIKEREAAARMAEYEISAAKASAEGAQFACSQTAFSEKDPQWENAMDINIPNFSISAAGKILFKDAVLSIGRGRRYGLVGPNGKGKSTLLKMIASNDLKIPPRIDFLYVEQEVVADETPAVEAVLRADAKRWALLEEEKALMKAVDDGDEDMVNIDRLQAVVEELTAMGSDSAEAKARRILFGLGFDMDMQVKPTKMFSGGWRMRISLARALFVEPTLLMLDEPTNHLDLNAVIWLDDYLQRWKKTLLVVSHDQDFLNSVTQEILHIEDLKLISYKGNYDSFKKLEKIRFQQHVKNYEKQEKRLRELKRGGQSKAKATETMKKKNTREPGARSKKAQNDAIASGVEGATKAELITRPREYHVKFSFADVAEIGRPVMQVNQVHFRYSPKHPVIFDNVDYGVDMDSRVCIVGPNGAGKSTLLKLMTGELEATSGDVKRNPRLKMGVYNQHFVDRLPMGKTPIEFLRDRFQDEDYQSVRNRLGKYGLEGHAHEVVMRDLSGGQKARVVFVELSLQRPHVLLLDEPTNNLDIESIDALIDAINEFNGGIVVVTHDQRLIENCNCNLWVVEKQKVTPWEKGFDDYKETLLLEMEEQIAKESAVRMKKLEEAAKAKAEKIALLASKLKAKKR